MAGRTLFRIFITAGALTFLASCAEYPTGPTNVAPAPQGPPPGYWNGEGVPGSPKIIVSIAEQRAYFFKGKNLVGESSVSTGKPGFGTPPGSYTVLSKDATHVSTVFGDYVDDAGNVVKSNIDSRKDPRPKGSHYDGARMPYAMFFRGGYAMHQGYVPPYAASHGCIRVPQGMAEIFFNAATVGTPVVVKAEAVKRTTTVPPLNPAPVTPPLVQSNLLVPVAPTSVRTTVPAPAPVRSPAPTLNRAPVPVRSPAPMVLRSPSPAPIRPTALRSTVPVVSPTPLRSSVPTVNRAPAPLQTPTPATLRSPAPTSVSTRTVSPQTTAPLRSPTPLPRLSPSPAPLQRAPAVPLRSPTPAPLQTPKPAALRSSAPPPAVAPAPKPAVSPTPTSTRSRKHGHVRSRHHSQSQPQTPAPSPAPSPAR